ncbi:MAG TPA: class I SAM-dependent methyltransferase [Kofleriaceae bacterium]
MKLATTDDVCDYLGIAGLELRPVLARLHDAAKALGESPHADLLRMDACHRLRIGQDAAFASREPFGAFVRIVEHAAAVLEATRALPLATTTLDPGEVSVPPPDFDEATAELRASFERNGFDLTHAASQRVLDAGCGDGRTSVALARLGFAEVVGFDFNPPALAIVNVQFVHGDVLHLPFADGEFDVVVSNGVLHHTYDAKRGLAEIRRVMKPGGAGWLELYQRPGGLDRLAHYISRLLLRDANREVCRRYCYALGVPANRSSLLLELWLSPIAECYTPAEVDDMLRAAGFAAWRREPLSDEPHAAVKYGVGDNRYVIAG